MPDVGLSWVIVLGTPRHVSDFAALAPRLRPRAHCPECGRALTLKLGRLRRHHAAHAPGDVCPATRAETALHLACKFALARRTPGRSRRMAAGGRYYAAKRGAWFLPNDMRDVGWDRDASDAFAAHPAWSRARSSVRERPTPEGSSEYPVFAAPPNAALFAHRVAGATVTRAAGAEHEIALIALGARVVVVIEQSASDDAIARVDDALARSGLERVWLSNPRHWTAALRKVTWVPAGRDERGRGAVVVDGLGVFRADQFLRAIAAGDPRLSGNELRARLAERGERLAAHRN